MNTKITLIALLALGLTASSCTRSVICVKGKGERVTETRTTSLFDEVTLEGSADIWLIQDPEATEAEIKITGQPNIIEELQTEVNGNELLIDFKHCVNYQRSLEIKIRVEDLSRIDVRGSGDIRTLGQFEGTSITADIDGSGDMDLLLDYATINVDVDGSGDIELDGETDLLDIDITGSGDVHSFGMESKQANIMIAGSGNVEVNASDVLVVKINGSGDVVYIGSPSMEVDIDGSGEVRQKN